MYPLLLENQYYHIYNRGNNGENLFYTRDNYYYFLKQYNHYLSEYLDTFAYCLLPNHFHLLVRVKPYSSFVTDDMLHKISKIYNIKSNDYEEKAALVCSDQFKKCFMAYAKAINKQEMRTGSLFQKIFKRKSIEDETHFSQLVYYIHANPQHHGIYSDFTNYPHSSYKSILSDQPTKLFRNEVIDWFGGKKEYLAFHKGMKDFSSLGSLIIESD